MKEAAHMRMSADLIRICICSKSPRSGVPNRLKGHLRGSISFLIALLTLSSSLADDIAREWTDVTGRKINASLRSASEAEVELVLDKGRTAKVPLADLSAKDQEYIRNWLAEEKKRDTYWQIDVVKTESESVPVFLKRHSGRSSSVRGGKYQVRGGTLQSVRFYSGSKVSFEVTNDKNAIIYIVKCKLHAPKDAVVPPQPLEFKHLYLLYRVRDNRAVLQEEVGPRWLGSNKSEIASAESVSAAEEFGVGFCIPNIATALQLRYEGQVTLNVPLR